jgi:uncharacterized protein YoxC
MHIEKILSPKDQAERDDCRSSVVPVSTNDLLQMELRLEKIILGLFLILKGEIKMSKDEAVAALTDLKTSLDAVSAEVTKVGAETDTLLAKIQALTDQINKGDVAPEVADALAAVTASANAVKTGVQAVDDKVPDIAPPTP